MGFRSALLFAEFNRRCAGFTREAAVGAKQLPQLVGEVVGFEVSRIRRYDPRLKERALRRQIDDGVRYVMATGSPEYRASMEDLEELARRVTQTNPDLRTADPQPGSSATFPAHSIPGALGRLFEWLQSPAFAEMHPVEQMTVCQARLFEIAPFAASSETISFCFSYIFPWSRFGLLPLYEPHELGPLHSALEDAVGLQTTPLVEINLRACQRACGFLAERS